MKRISFLLIGCALGAAIAATNPKQKGKYIDHVAAEVQSLCCANTFISSQSTCTALRPLTKPVLTGIIYAYTETPRDYLFFTQYTTYLPGHTVHGIGIVGQFAFWSDSHAEGTCPLFNIPTL